MNITGISMVRDEADILGPTVRNLCEQGITHLIVADNGSTDGTREAFAALGSYVTVIDDTERGYYQSEKMTRLAQQAFEQGADWVLPFDADEWWYSTEGTIAEALAATDANVVAATEFKHWPTPWDDPGDPNPYTRLRHRETQPHRLHKVCFRARDGVKVHMGNHGVNFGAYNPDRMDPALPLLKLRHLPYRSFAQFCRKVRNGREAYEAADRMHPMFGTHWREMGAMSDDDLKRLWSDATSGYEFGHEWMGHGDLIEDPAP